MLIVAQTLLNLLRNSTVETICILAITASGFRNIRKACKPYLYAIISNAYLLVSFLGLIKREPAK